MPTTTLRTLLNTAATATNQGEVTLTDGQQSLNISPTRVAQAAALGLALAGWDHADTPIQWDMDATGAVAEITRDGGEVLARLEIDHDGARALCNAHGCYARINPQLESLHRNLTCDEHLIGRAALSRAVGQIVADRTQLDQREAGLVATARAQMNPDEVTRLFREHGAATTRVQALATEEDLWSLPEVAAHMRLENPHGPTARNTAARALARLGVPPVGREAGQGGGNLYNARAAAQALATRPRSAD